LVPKVKIQIKFQLVQKEEENPIWAKIQVTMQCPTTMNKYTNVDMNIAAPATQAEPLTLSDPLVRMMRKRKMKR
jgi:hypothetical protein